MAMPKTLALILLLAAGGQEAAAPAESAPPRRTIERAGATAARTLEDRLADTIDVKDFGARGDGVTNDAPAIQAAIAAAEEQTKGASVYFPGGIYKVATTLRVSKGYLRLHGPSRAGGGSPAAVSGATLSGVGGMGEVIRVQPASGILYQPQIDHLQIRSDGAGADPVGISIVSGSEVYVSQVQLGQHLSEGLRLNGVAMGWVDHVSTSTTGVGIRLTVSGGPAFSQCSDLYFRGLNLWQSSKAGILVDSFASNVVVRDSWIENAPAGILLAPAADADMLVDGLLLDAVNVFNGAASPYSQTRYLLAQAQRTAGHYLRTTNISIRNARSYQYGASRGALYHVELLRNGNGNRTTAFLGTRVDGGQWYGASGAIVRADGAPATGSVDGNVTALAGYQTGAATPYKAGPGTWDTTESGTWTPADASGAGLSFAIADAGDCRWTKIGRMVFASFAFTYPATASGSAALWSGLPFASASTATSLFGGTLSYTDAGVSIRLLVTSNATTVGLRDDAGAAIADSALSGKKVRGTIVYEAQ
jgi:hypothetical protein